MLKTFVMGRFVSSMPVAGWQLEKAFDMAQEVDALFTNFDASVYTIIFIPADSAGVLPPGAEKYLKQVEYLLTLFFLCDHDRASTVYRTYIHSHSLYL